MKKLRDILYTFAGLVFIISFLLSLFVKYTGLGDNIIYAWIAGAVSLGVMMFLAITSKDFFDDDGCRTL